jgi:hypothetical protein
LVERVYESCDPFILNGLSDPNHAMLTSPRAKNQGLARSKDRLWRWQRKNEQVYRARTSTDFVLTDTSGSVRVSQAAVLGMQDDILITTGSRFVTASGMQEKTLTIGEFSVAIADFTSHFLEIPERSRLIGYRCTERVLPINVNAFARGQLTQIAPQGEIILDKGTQSPFVLSLKPGHLVEIHNSGSSSGTRNMSYVSYLAGISLLGYYFLQSTAAAATDRLVRG